MKIQQLKKYIKEQLTSDRKDDRQPSNPEANCDAGMGGFGVKNIVPDCPINVL